MNFKQELAKRTEEVENIIYSFLPLEEGRQKTIFEAVNYSMHAGGKRIRPLLMLESYRLFGGTEKVIEPFLAAIEMIHTYSLVHDDLPAMDNDEYRRGKKTTHIVYGEAMGILAGDGLLNLAFETALNAYELMPDERIVKALQILAEKSGMNGMIGGQTVDIEFVARDLSLGDLEFIFRLKTAALIEASMVIGAVLAGAKDEEIETLRSAAQDIGMAFQIQDDILDVTGKAKELGKTTHSDEKNNKVTYVTLKGVDGASEDVRVYSERALASLALLGKKNKFLDELILYLIDRRK